MEDHACDKLVPLHQAWNDATDELHAAKLEYARSPSDSAHAAFRDAAGRVAESHSSFEQAEQPWRSALETLSLRAIDRLVLETICKALTLSRSEYRSRPEYRQLACDTDTFWEEPGRLKAIEVREIKIDASDRERINAIFPLLAYLPWLEKISCASMPLKNIGRLPAGLKTLDFYGTQITRMPDLPDTLEHADFRNTPAFTLDKYKRENVTRAEAFMDSHPDAWIVHKKLA